MSAGRGGRLVPLLVLLGLLVGAGGYNYSRNAMAEEAELRPFRGYREVDLEALLAAYEGELDEAAARFRAASGRRVDVRDRGLLGDQIREFERIQGISQRTRALAGEVAEIQVAIDQIHDELARRERDRPAYKKHLRRIFHYEL